MFSYILVISTAYILLISSFLMSEVEVGKITIIATILVIIFLHFLIIQLWSESPQVKRYLISSITNLVHELPHEFPNDLRLTILGNQDILEKCQMWQERQPSTQSSFQKLNVDNTYFFTLCQIFCPGLQLYLQFYFNITSNVQQKISQLFLNCTEIPLNFLCWKSRLRVDFKREFVLQARRKKIKLLYSQLMPYIQFSPNSRKSCNFEFRLLSYLSGL